LKFPKSKIYLKTILFKIWKFPQLSETFIVNQIVTAIKLGYEVKILVGEAGDPVSNSNNELFSKYNLSDKILIEDYDVPKNKMNRYFKGILLFLKNISNLILLIKYYNLHNQKGLLPLFEFNFYNNFRKIHAIHIQFGTNKHPVDLLKRIGFLKGKVIVSFHGHDLHFPINGHIQSMGYYDNLFETSEHLICNTLFLKLKIKSLGASSKKIIVLPVPVDTLMFKPDTLKSIKRTMRLITVGRIDELKGQIHGIRIVKKLIDEGYNVEYLIVGRGKYSEILRKEIDLLDLSDHVKLLGAQTPQEVLLWYQSSDIFLMTSITNELGMAESQGIVTAEAQACGLPVVAFDSGGIKYTLQEKVTGFLCPEKNLECYTEKLKILMDNPKLRNEMGENARKFIEAEYSEISVLSKWKELYG
tara:strand:- start:14320 stop:15564 length:1245 start_codon:yes stop_codon:yes gene_type:complete